MRSMKRILALLLCLVMVFGCMPTVFAASGNVTQPGNSDWSEDQDPDATEPDGSIDIPVEDLFVQWVSIEVTKMPTKTIYERGEALDTTGMTLKAISKSGATQTVTEGFTVSGYDPETIGTQTVTVAYSGLTTTFQVEVLAAPARMLVTPSKTDVEWGDEVVITVSVTGDEEYTSLGFIPVVDTNAYKIINAEVATAIMQDSNKVIAYIDLTDGGAVAFDKACTYEGDVFVFTIKIKDKSALDKIVFTDTYSMVNVGTQVSVSLNETYMNISAPEANEPVVETTPVADLNAIVNEEESGIVIGGSTATNVVIADSYVVDNKEKPVIEIAPNAFKDNTTVETVVIPSTVVTVGQDAFTGSTVSEITVKGSKTDISDSGIKDVENVVVVAPIGSKAHDYALEHNLAFRALLAFYSANVVLTDDLGLRYKVSEAVFTDNGYTDPYVIFEINGKRVAATSDMVVPDEKAGKLHVFSYMDIAPYMVKDSVTATLYVTDADGYLCSSEPKEYSVKNYCHDMLNHESTQGNAELQTLLVDMLNYGAAAQEYVGYHTDNLANKDLTAEELAKGTQEAPVSENKLNTAVAVPETVKATFKGAGLYLDETVSLRFGFEAANTRGLTVQVAYTKQNGESAVKTFTEKDFVKSGSRYYVYFSELIASQMRQTVQATIYEGNTAVSNTINYSIESYVAQAQGNAKLSKIVNALLSYGDAAAKYASK